MDEPSLAGHWALTCAEMAGETAPEILARKATLEIGAEGYCVRFDGVAVDAGELELVTGLPGALILRGKSGPNAGRAIPAIYRFAELDLEICYGFAGEHPTDFRTQVGTPWYLARYRRAPA